MHPLFCVGLCKFIRLFLITARFVLYSSILIFAHHLSNRQIGSKTWIRGNYMLNIRFRFGNILLFFFLQIFTLMGTMPPGAGEGSPTFVCASLIISMVHGCWTFNLTTKHKCSSYTWQSTPKQTWELGCIDWLKAFISSISTFEPTQAVGNELLLNYKWQWSILFPSLFNFSIVEKLMFILLAFFIVSVRSGRFNWHLIGENFQHCLYCNGSP